jgi:type II restriction/modification system DNA methylase subunit YeeA
MYTHTYQKKKKKKNQSNAKTHTVLKEHDIDLEVFFSLDTFVKGRDLSKKKRILEERIVGKLFFYESRPEKNRYQYSLVIDISFVVVG